MNLRGILDGKQTIHYESISDILISMFSGINKCSQGRNIFVIDFGSSQYQKFVISLICVSPEFPAYNVSAREHILVLTMAPRIRNKKKTKQITSPLQTGNDSGRPPGPATTIAGSSLAPTPAPNQRRRSVRWVSLLRPHTDK